jgi:pyruvate carboxylase
MSVETYACDCESQGNFLKVSPNSDLVALVKVNQYLTFKDIYDSPTPMSMEVEVIEVFKGVENRKKVKVWG